MVGSGRSKPRWVPIGITAATEFSAYLHGYVDARRAAPADDLITHLIADPSK